MTSKAGFGGGCHWCTEAVFESLLAVEKVEQGWISPDQNAGYFSEAVVVTFDNRKISFETLIAVHLYTHSCTAEHAMRSKYRSAVYTFSDDDIPFAQTAIKKLQQDFEMPIITQVLRFGNFKINREESLHYYFSDPEKPFCETYINPKLRLLLEKFSANVDTDKISFLKPN